MIEFFIGAQKEDLGNKETLSFIQRNTLNLYYLQRLWKNVTLGARSFSRAVSGVRYLFGLRPNKARTKLVFFAARVQKTREKPLVPRAAKPLVRVELTNGEAERKCKLF